MRWTKHIVDEGFPRRVNHAAAAVDNQIYSFGGHSIEENIPAYSSMDVHLLDIITGKWKKLPISDLPCPATDNALSSRPYRRYGHTAVVYKDQIYIWGGLMEIWRQVDYTDPLHGASVLYKFDPILHCWTAPPTTGTIPPYRESHTASVWDKFMVVFGGYHVEWQSPADTDVFLLDLETFHWSKVVFEGLATAVRRSYHTTVCIGNMIYLFGGLWEGEELYSNTIWCLNMISHKAHCCPATGDIPMGRRSHSAFVHNKKMYIFGGFTENVLTNTDTYLNDLHMFDPLTNTWTKINPKGNSPCPRRRQACVKVGEQVFIFGGISPRLLRRGQHTIRNTSDLVDHNDLHILDLNPSLKTLCMSAVREYNLEDAELPQSLRMELLRCSPCSPISSGPSPGENVLHSLELQNCDGYLG